MTVQEMAVRKPEASGRTLPYRDALVDTSGRCPADYHMGIYDAKVQARLVQRNYSWCVTA